MSLFVVLGVPLAPNVALGALPSLLPCWHCFLRSAILKVGQGAGALALAFRRAAAAPPRAVGPRCLGAARRVGLFLPPAVKVGEVWRIMAATSDTASPKRTSPSCRLIRGFECAGFKGARRVKLLKALYWHTTFLSIERRCAASGAKRFFRVKKVRFASKLCAFSP